MLLFIALFALACAQLTKIGSDLTIDGTNANYNHPVVLDSGLVANFYQDFGTSWQMSVRLLDLAGTNPSLTGSTVIYEGNSSDPSDEVALGALHIGGERVLVNIYNDDYDLNYLLVVDCAGAVCVAGPALSLDTQNGYVYHYGRNKNRGVYLGDDRAVSIFQENLGGGAYRLVAYLVDTSSNNAPVALSGPTTLESGTCGTGKGCPWDPESSLVIRSGTYEFVVTNMFSASGVTSVWGQKYTVLSNVITKIGNSFDIAEFVSGQSAYVQDDISLYGGEGYILAIFGSSGNVDNGNSTFGTGSVLGVIIDTLTDTPTAVGPAFILSSPNIDGYQWSPSAAAFRTHRAFVVSYTDNLTGGQPNDDKVFANVYCFDTHGAPTALMSSPVQISPGTSGVDEYHSSTTVSGSRVVFSWFEDSNSGLFANVWQADLSLCSRISSGSSSSSAAELNTMF